jgi:Tn3 transposase DDE domain
VYWPWGEQVEGWATGRASYNNSLVSDDASAVLDLDDVIAPLLVGISGANLLGPRLIANAIIYYNTLLLSRVYEHKLAANDQNAIEILKGISPVAWRNVNLIGNFDFTTGTSPVDIEALAERYENRDFWRRSLQEADDDGPAY